MDFLNSVTNLVANITQLYNTATRQEIGAILVILALAVVLVLHGLSQKQSKS